MFTCKTHPKLYLQTYFCLIFTNAKNNYTVAIHSFPKSLTKHLSLVWKTSSKLTRKRQLIFLGNYVYVCRKISGKCTACKKNHSYQTCIYTLGKEAILTSKNVFYSSSGHRHGEFVETLSFCPFSYRLTVAHAERTFVTLRLCLPNCCIS